MKIGPVDIRNHGFSKKKMRGFDEGEVTAFLDLVADRMEEVLLEAEDLRGRISRLETELSNYRELDRTLRDSLLSAERLSDGRLEQAEREARIVLKNAEVEGEKRIIAAQNEANAIRSSLDDLRRQRLTYVERFRALLRSQIKILEASVESYAPDLADVEETIDRIDSSVRRLESERSAPRASASAAPGPTSLPLSVPPSPQGTPRPTPSSYLGEEGLFSTRATDPSSRLEED